MPNNKIITTPWSSNNGPVFDTPTFAIGDVHGQADALEHLLTHIDALRISDDDGEIIFTGDLIDRGPESLRSVDLAVQACLRFNHSAILPGNHEIMMMTCLLRKGTREDFDRWYYNGGAAVINEVDPCEEGTLSEAFDKISERLDQDFIDTIVKGPTYLIRNRVLFVHAGIHPQQDLDVFLSQDRFGPPQDSHWAWMRHPFLSWEGGWEHHDLDLVVHGHTPATTKFIVDEKEATFLLDKAEDFHCVCLDAGAMRVPQVCAVEFRGEEHRLHVAQVEA
jgi:serine/threonine protein phosphatase 1